MPCKFRPDTSTFTVTLRLSTYINMQPLLVHPTIVIFCQVTLNALFIGFTSPRSSFRYAPLPILLMCAWVVIEACLEKTQSIVLTGILVTYSTSAVLQYIETALLSKWDFESRSPTSCRSLSTRATPNLNLEGEKNESVIAED